MQRHINTYNNREGLKSSAVPRGSRQRNTKQSNCKAP